MNRLQQACTSLTATVRPGCGNADGPDTAADSSCTPLLRGRPQQGPQRPRILASDVLSARPLRPRSHAPRASGGWGRGGCWALESDTLAFEC